MNKFNKEDLDNCPSMEEMFRRADKIKEQRKYTTEELIKLIKDRRNEELHLVKRFISTFQPHNKQSL